MRRYLILFLASTALWAADWPQWRGAERDGKSPSTGLLREWPEGGPKLAWRAQGFGGGYSSLAVVGDAIYTLGDKDGSQYIFAANRADGAVKWSTKIGPEWKDKYGGARGTPTYAGGKLYALSAHGLLVCVKAADGAEVWKRDLVAEYKGKMAGERYNWKFAESPLVDEGKVVVCPGGPSSAMVALDAASGKEIWRCTSPALGEAGADGAAYASIVISQAGNTKQYVQLTGRGVIGVEAKTGRFLWGYNRIANDVANIPTPIVKGEDVFVSTGYGTGAARLRIERDGGKWTAHELYFLTADNFQNHHGGMILKDGFIYAGSGHNKGFPLCVALEDGSTKWGPVRNQGTGSAAISYADGLLFMRYQNGLMVLVEASPDDYREKGSFMIPDVNNFSWSHPVIVDGKLYLREQDNLFCYDIAG